MLATLRTLEGYSKEPKSVTSFNQLTFFPADINQSEVEDSFPLPFDWIKSVRKNVSINQKRSHFWTPCCNKKKERSSSVQQLQF